MQCDRDKALDLFYGRMNDCIHDLRDGLQINFTDELKNLKLDLILWAMTETRKNIAQASKMLNINRTTMTSMLSNELAPYIRKRKIEKRKLKES